MNFRKEAQGLFKSKFFQVLPFTMLYGFFIVLVLALAFFVPPSLILTVPFVVLPSTFALQISVSHINNNFPPQFKIFFIGFGLYFSSKGFGCYNSLGGFLKSLGVFVFFEGILEIILSFVWMKYDPALKELLTNVSIDSYLTLATQLMNNASFVKITKISTLVGMLFAFYMFAHHIFSHGMKANLIMYNANSPVTMPMYKAMHKQFFPMVRKEYYKDYYSTIWPIIPVYFVSYAGGACLAYFLLEDTDFMQCQVIALAVAFIVCFTLLPLVSNAMENLYKKYSPRYNELSVKSVKASFEELMKSKDLSEEQKRALEDIVKSAEEKQNKDKEESQDK
ncbi:MAG: hypothetical protein K6E11_04480 [Bacilli bacterium]|nr:hypothetical protein [Bacilli bacterium]